MTEELRDLLRDELGAERPPPLGDLVGAAVRDGRRIRRRRRLAAAGGGTAVAGVLAVAVALGGPFGAAPRPGAPAAASARAVPLVGIETGATPEAMLVLLRELLPAGRTGDYAKSGDGALDVRMTLDRGAGPGMIRVSVAGYPSVKRTGQPAVTVDGVPDNCVQSRIVRAEWPGGLTVQADLSTCLPAGGATDQPSPPALTDDEAKAVVADPRWGVTMDAALVAAGPREFPHVATVG